MSQQLHVLTVGRSQRGPAAELEDRYLQRIGRFIPIRRVSVAAGRQATATLRRQDEARRLLRQRPARGLLIALQIEGTAFDSTRWTKRLAAWRERGELMFVVGGPDGLDRTVLEQADERISLGPITLSHELAAIVLLEQLYRALADDAGHPFAKH
jgi:23S rRNA (pseudouridine1915-N3)-methyltransferase